MTSWIKNKLAEAKVHRTLSKRKKEPMLHKLFGNIENTLISVSSGDDTKKIVEVVRRYIPQTRLTFLALDRLDEVHTGFDGLPKKLYFERYRSEYDLFIECCEYHLVCAYIASVIKSKLKVCFFTNEKAEKIYNFFFLCNEVNIDERLERFFLYFDKLKNVIKTSQKKAKV